jgi:class 3 adenylate cyclase
MDSNHKSYDHLASFARVDDILGQPAGNYEEVNNLPDRSRLSYTNGFYGMCTACFVDIQDSSDLPDFYRRPVLAKIYRAFISELVAILNSDLTAREINIVGDCVWGLYNTTKRVDIDRVLELAGKALSLLKVLNYKMVKQGYDKRPIQVGIGLSYGRALMVKAGLSGSGISDVIYMGDVVNTAAHLAAKAGKLLVPPVLADSDFYSYLKDDYKKLFSHKDYRTYQTSVWDIAMETWYQVNCT